MAGKTNTIKLDISTSRITDIFLKVYFRVFSSLKPILPWLWTSWATPRKGLWHNLHMHLTKAIKMLCRIVTITKFFRKVILRGTNSMLRIFWVVARIKPSRKNYRISSKIPKELEIKEAKARHFQIRVVTAIKIWGKLFPQLWVSKQNYPSPTALSTLKNNPPKPIATKK